MRCLYTFCLASAVFCAFPAVAQQTTNINLNFTLGMIRGRNPSARYGDAENIRASRLGCRREALLQTADA